MRTEEAANSPVHWNPGSDASQVQWTFDPPDGDTLVVSVDMQVQFGRHWGRAGTVSLLDDQAKPVVTASFKTWLSP